MSSLEIQFPTAEIVHIPDDTSEEDDDVEIIYVVELPLRKKGSSRSNPIPVDNYIIRFHHGESSDSKFTCEICADDKPRNHLFTKLGCAHSYCTDCVSKYVASRLQNNVTKITCPAAGCEGGLEPEQCGSVLPKQVLDRWGDALCEALLLGIPKMYCPYRECRAMLLVEGSCGAESECPYCRRMLCGQCGVPWHSGMTCEEFGKLKVEERSSEDLLMMNLARSMKWMRCSRCGFFVERTEGCLFMTCRCRHTFCYSCGATLTEHYCRVCRR